MVIDATWLLDSDAVDLLNSVLKKKKEFKLAKVLITTVPFGDRNRLPLELLENANTGYLINPLNKKHTEDQLA